MGTSRTTDGLQVLLLEGRGGGDKGLFTLLDMGGDFSINGGGGECEWM